MTPREAGIQAFYADESTSNTLQGLNAAFDAYEAALQREPVAWQSRARQSMEGDHGPWSSWRDGKSPKPIPPYWEVEERALFAISKAKKA